MATREALLCALALLLLWQTPRRADGARGFYLNQTFGNNRTIYFLNNEGLTGSFAAYQAFRAFNSMTRNIDYTLWFTNSTPDSFTLSLLASNLPPDPQGLENGWIPQHAQVVEGRIIWSANPNRPVKRNASLNLTADGNLVLRDADGTLVWSSGTSNTNVYNMWLTDFATLAFWTKDNTSVWDSSQHPTTTLMQNQVLKPGSSLTSSVDYLNTTQGPYKLVMEPGGLVMYYSTPAPSRSQLAYWVWGKKNMGASNLADVLARRRDGQSLSASLCYNGSALLLQLQSSSPNFVTECSSEASYPLPSDASPSPGKNETLMTLQPDGDLAFYAWGDTNWTMITSVFASDPCGLPMRCGPYGTCSSNGKCGCPEAYAKLENGIGCNPEIARNKAGSCSRNFLKLEGHDYFANNYNKEAAGSAEECKNRCKQNCSCEASFYRKTNGSSGGLCFLAEEGTVGTIRQVSGTSRDNYQAFLRVEVLPGKRRSRTGAIVGGVAGAVAASFLLGLLLCYRPFRKPATDTESEVDEEDLMLELGIKSIMPTRYTYEELRVITNDFCEKLGAGSFGSVFKGMLEDGTQVAVKKLDKAGSNVKEFYAEIASLARNRQFYLVQLLGYSMKRSSRLLVYEYMANGSLDGWLFDQEKRRTLNWKARMNIAVGTARGLAYLHEECSEKIIHLDLKPQNILLDSQFNAKIGDFGLSKLMDRDQSIVMTMMRGTPGYLAPEWLVEGAISEKVDVFSFGVVLLELVSGRKSRELLVDGSSRAYIMELAIKDEEAEELGYPGSLGTETLIRLMDFLVDLSCDPKAEKEVRRALRIAVVCIQEDPNQRPCMSKVVQMLGGSLPVAKLVQLPSSSRVSSTFSISRLLLQDVSSGTMHSSSSSSTSAFIKSTKTLLR